MTRPRLHLFPFLHTVYLYDYNLLPLFMSPNLSTIHLTITPDLLDRHGHLVTVSNALKDYTSKVTSLHVYPQRGGDAGQSRVVSDMCSLVASIHSTLVHASFPMHIITYDLIKQLMRCPNLRTLGYNTHSLRSSVDICKGSERDLVHSYADETNFEGDMEEKLFSVPYPLLTKMNIMVPTANAVHRIFTGITLANLETLDLHFLGSQQGAQAPFDLGPLLEQLHCSSSQLAHLSLFVLPPQCLLIEEMAPVGWSGLRVLAKFDCLVSFQFSHPYPVEVTRIQLGSILAMLPRLTKFILNPHPLVHRESSFGPDVLANIAHSRPELKELGLFFNKPVAAFPNRAQVTRFAHLEVLYTGTSMVSKDKDALKAVCYWFIDILPDHISLEHYPKDFHFLNNKRSFTVDPINGKLVDTKLRTYIDASQLWLRVETVMETIKDVRVDYSHLD